MAKNLYESIFTRNSQLAKFFDENYNIAKAVKKIVGLVVRIAEDLRVPASELEYEVYAPRGAEIVVVRIVKKEHTAARMKSVRDQG